MTARKFFKTKITIEVLSEEPISDDMSLADIAFQGDEGDYSIGNNNYYKQTVLNGKQAAKALKKQGSDPSFFRLNDEGEDNEE